MRLIDADALFIDVIRCIDYCDDILALIEHQPTIEPEIKKGAWICHTEPLVFKPYGYYTCNLCNEISWEKSNYCSNCGASMVGEEDETN